VSAHGFFLSVCTAFNVSKAHAHTHMHAHTCMYVYKYMNVIIHEIKMC